LLHHPGGAAYSHPPELSSGSLARIVHGPPGQRVLNGGLALAQVHDARIPRHISFGGPLREYSGLECDLVAVREVR
jgi:hypothetical protein